VKNGCGDAVPFEDRGSTAVAGQPITARFDADGKPLSLCGEAVQNIDDTGGVSQVPEGLPKRVNDQGNWAARGTLLFQPTLDTEWLLTAQGGRRNEQSRLGQAIGTFGQHSDFDCLVELGPDPTAAEIESCTQLKWLGGSTERGYQSIEIKERLAELDPCRFLNEQGQLPFVPLTECTKDERRLSQSKSEEQLSDELAVDLDSDPYRVDVNRVGMTTNDVWGLSLKGDMVLGDSVSMTTVSGYNTYDRSIDVDLDFTPNQLFEFLTKDDGWQFTQDLSFSGYISEDYPLRWEIGGYYMKEQLNVGTDTLLSPLVEPFGVPRREYKQDLQSAAGYVSLAWDFWEDFTLDGGARYNWEEKQIDFVLFEQGVIIPKGDFKKRVWQAPTGTVRLTYRFREDTHAYWKYTRGWKGGHFNATGSLRLFVTVAEPETIDSFEMGLRGSWFNGRLGANFSVFHYNYENYQIFTAIQVKGTPPEFVVINASSAEVYGAELDLVARPLPGLYLQARLSWLESQFLDFTQVNQTLIDGNIFTSEVQNTGNPLLNSPSYKVSLTAEQTIPLGRFGTLTARWDGAWTDDTNYDATNSRGVPNIVNEQFLPEHTIGQSAYWLHNVRLAYRTPSGAIEVAGFVRNVENTSYKTFAFDGSQFQNTTIYFVGDPRTYGVTVTTTF
jgi:outer membrane receptor protein involved in Fe transport